jgi:2,3-bisphosphoglycerate-independent phosphoglycerate mutase
MNKVVLVILDGWGYAKGWGGNAITIAQTLNYDRILRSYPNGLICASGVNVGLPGHEMGNSEVGHMNLGAGRIVKQDISQINEAVMNGRFYSNSVLKNAILQSKESDSALHLLGIVSDGGVHSHIVHLFALLKLCHDLGHKKVFVHAFTDGRDTDPMSGLEFIEKLSSLTNVLKGPEIATVIGRSYLDRKGDWSKTKVVYDALVDSVGLKAKSALAAVSNAYRRGETDEFITPTIVGEKRNRISDGDTVISFNFRSDRTRQLISALFEKDFVHFERRAINPARLVTFVPYGIEKELKINAEAAFPSIVIGTTVSSVLENLKMRQFHIAETEKYPHVTYFFNGNRENPHLGEDRMIIPSPNVASYALKPEMSGEDLNRNLINTIKRDYYNFIVCNFANADMVGHTGDFDAAVNAVEFIDSKLSEIVKVCIDKDTPLVITADHGNIEQMVDPATGNPDTEHTNNPVPIIVIDERYRDRLSEKGRLSNVAKTCFELAGIKTEQFDKPLIRNIDKP